MSAALTAASNRTLNNLLVPLVEIRSLDPEFGLDIDDVRAARLSPLSQASSHHR